MNKKSPLESALLAKNRRKKTRITLKNEKKILDAAQLIIAEYGFHGATIDLIAEQADISKPNLHYYFSSKKELYIAVLRRTLDIWLSSLSKLDPDGDPEVELTRYIREKVGMSRDHPLASRVFANEILRGAPELETYLKTELKTLVKKKSEVIQHWIDHNKLAKIDPMHLLFLIWAATQHYADFAPQIQAVMGIKKITDKDFEEIEFSLCKIILKGCLPEASK